MSLVVDWEHQQLESILNVIDEALKPLLAVVRWDEQARDAAEYWVGVGFVACQKYVASTSAFMNVEKPKALDLGPTRDGGATVTSLVNAAANHWKHSDEWLQAANRSLRGGHPEPKNKQMDRALDILATVLSDGDWHYPLSGTLHALAGTVSFAPLLPLLVNWTEAIAKAAPSQTRA